MWPTSTNINLQQNALKFQPCGGDDDDDDDDNNVDNPFVTFDNMYVFSE
jgi:hypothetical protein